MDSNNLKSKVGHLAKTKKIITNNGMITAKGMLTDVTMWGIYIRFFSSRGYSFKFTNSAYEMSMRFSNIRGLTLST